MVDVSVLILFFTRSETLKEVFQEVRKAKPARLLLYQDGPRSEADLAGIEACRQIVDDSQIDWPCEVYRNYQDRNYGCDPSGFMAHRWAFSITDKCIVLEDDVVPSQSFFTFCKEMLDRYEHDERITMVSGFNIDEQTDLIQTGEAGHEMPCDYFFTSEFAIWGWASWRRVVEKWDGDYSFLDDPYTMRLLEGVRKQRGFRRNIYDVFRRHRDSGKQYFETIFRAEMLMNNGLAIVPRVNMINNIGLTADATHTSATLNTMPKGLRRLFTMKRHELAFPLRHPLHVIEDVSYKDRMYRAYAWDHPWIKLKRSFEELWLNAKQGQWSYIAKMAKRRFG